MELVIQHPIHPCFGSLTLRRVVGTPYYVSKNGRHYTTENHPHIITTMGKNPDIPYLSCGKDNHMHVMVAKAWVYNPCPRKFHWVDHIDGDKQNNESWNLRWVSPSLNGLNKERNDYGGTKQVKKYKSGKMGVWWKTTVTIGGKTKTLTRGTKSELEKACKQTINDTWINQYDADVAAYEKPERADFLSYWKDYLTTPVMRPGFVDTPTEWTCEARSASYIL